MSDEAKVVGKPLDRVDGRLKVTGKARYTAEHHLPGLAYGVLVGSTIAEGRIAAIDTAAAEEAPGVIAILTHRNAPALPEWKEVPGTPNPSVGKPCSPCATTASTTTASRSRWSSRTPSSGRRRPRR